MNHNIKLKSFRYYDSWLVKAIAVALGGLLVFIYYTFLRDPFQHLAYDGIMIVEEYLDIYIIIAIVAICYLSTIQLFKFLGIYKVVSLEDEAITVMQKRFLSSNKSEVRINYASIIFIRDINALKNGPSHLKLEYLSEDGIIKTIQFNKSAFYNKEDSSEILKHIESLFKLQEVGAESPYFTNYARTFVLVKN